MTTTLTRLINAIALPICLAAMDACWIYAVVWLFQVVVLSVITLSPVPAPPVLAGLELAAWGLSAYLLDRTSLPVGVARWLVGIVGILVCVGLSLALDPEVDITNLVLWLSVAGYSAG